MPVLSPTLTCLPYLFQFHTTNQVYAQRTCQNPKDNTKRTPCCIASQNSFHFQHFSEQKTASTLNLQKAKQSYHYYASNNSNAFDDEGKYAESCGKSLKTRHFSRRLLLHLSHHINLTKSLDCGSLSTNQLRSTMRNRRAVFSIRSNSNPLYKYNAPQKKKTWEKEKATGRTRYFCVC